MSPFEIMDLIREAADAEREKHVRIMRILERLIDEERAKNREVCAVIREERELKNALQEKNDMRDNVMGRIAIALFGEKNNRTDEGCLIEVERLRAELNQAREALIDAENLLRAAGYTMEGTATARILAAIAGVPSKPSPASGLRAELDQLRTRSLAIALVEPVLDELDRATTKFPTWPNDPLHALAVLGEEFGELNKALLQLMYEPHKGSPSEARAEAIQTAAMALRLLISLDRYDYRPGAQHAQGAPA